VNRIAQGKPKYVCVDCKTHRKILNSEYLIPHCPKCGKQMLRVRYGFSVPSQSSLKWDKMKKIRNFFIQNFPNDADNLFFQWNSIEDVNEFINGDYEKYRLAQINFTKKLKLLTSSCTFT
jgi:predicted RNA-binding Zn-ribbon protein involved in translation (DUF1610 family)